MTNRLLLEAVGLHLYERWGNMQLQKRGSLDDEAAASAIPSLISVVEQSTGLIYRMGGIGQGPSTLGFNNTLVYGNRVYTDGGPQNYNTNLLGLVVNVRL